MYLFSNYNNNGNFLTKPHQKKNVDFLIVHKNFLRIKKTVMTMTFQSFFNLKKSQKLQIPLIQAQQFNLYNNFFFFFFFLISQMYLYNKQETDVV